MELRRQLTIAGISGVCPRGSTERPFSDTPSPLRQLQTEIVDGFSTIGGGSAPGAALPTRLLALSAIGLGADALAARLRRLDPPVIARIEHDRLVLDLRTVLPEQDELLAHVLLTVDR